MLPEKELVKRFEKELEVYKEESSYINPLEVFESYYFHHVRYDIGYREEALNRCISERVNFSLTENNLGNIMKNFVNIKCPECGNDMEYACNSEYRCKCGNKVELHLDEFMFLFSHTPWFKVEALNRCEGEEGEVTIPIKAWFTEKDTEGQIVAHITKYNKRIGNKWLVRINYFNERARTDEVADKLILEIYHKLQLEGLEKED